MLKSAFDSTPWLGRLHGCSATDDEMFTKIVAGQLYFSSPAWDNISNLAKVGLIIMMMMMMMIMTTTVFLVQA